MLTWKSYDCSRHPRIVLPYKALAKIVLGNTYVIDMPLYKRPILYKFTKIWIFKQE